MFQYSIKSGLYTGGKHTFLGLLQNLVQAVSPQGNSLLAYNALISKGPELRQAFAGTEQPQFQAGKTAEHIMMHA